MTAEKIVNKTADEWLAGRLDGNAWSDPLVGALASALYDGPAQMERKIMEAANASTIGCSAAAEAVTVLFGRLGSHVNVGTAACLFMYGYAVGAADVGRMFAPESQAALVEAFRNGFEKEAKGDE